MNISSLEVGANKFFVDEALDELQMQQKANLTRTSRKVASILVELSCKYAIPNEVNVFLLGNKIEYHYAIQEISKSSFVNLAEAPLGSCFNDQSRGVHEGSCIPIDVF